MHGWYPNHVQYIQVYELQKCINHEHDIYNYYIIIYYIYVRTVYIVPGFVISGSSSIMSLGGAERADEDRKPPLRDVLTFDWARSAVDKTMFKYRYRQR